MPIRLTLRSMLNYMDDVLEPADAAEIAQAIEKSEFATSLMHRIRDVTKRLRLAAPKVEGRGMGLDPNTVAEYLDNTLHGDRVPEFEKVCLESDVHLAEIASVHQILTLVLGEPAEIDPVSRMRMYALIEDLDKPAAVPLTTSVVVTGAAAPAVAAPEAHAGHAAAEPPAKHKLEVPDYLRDTPPQRSLAATIAIAIALLLLVGGGLALAVNRAAVLAALGLKAEDVAQAPHVDTERTPAAAETSKPPEDAPTTVVTPTGVPVQLPPTTAAPASPAPPAASPPLVNPEDKRPAATPSSAPGKPEPPAAPEPPAPAADKPAMKPGDAPAAPPATVPPAATAPAAATGDSASKPSPPKTDGDKPTPPPPAPPEGIGRVISDKQVLLRYDRSSKSFKRLAAATTVMTGDQLLALPGFNPELALSAGVNLRLVGDAAVELLPLDNRGVPGVRLVYGRLVLLSAGRPGAPFRVQAGDRQGTLILANADSIAALEVRFRRKDGTDPEDEPAQVQADLYAAAGEVTWTDGSDPQPQTVKAPALRVLSGQSPGASPLVAGTEYVAAWINSDSRVNYEKLAAVAVEDELARPERASAVVLGLRELAVNSRVEVRLLAVTCLSHLGDYELILATLRDETQKAYWTAPRGPIETLQDALARGPSTAAAVREAFFNHRGKEKGGELYRLLWGFSLDQLQTGAAAQLVKWLEHQDLDYRVLSFANLLKATGGASLGYRPEFTQAQRQQSLRTWNTRLQSGQLLPKP